MKTKRRTRRTRQRVIGGGTRLRAGGTITDLATGKRWVIESTDDAPGVQDLVLRPIKKTRARR